MTLFRTLLAALRLLIIMLSTLLHGMVLLPCSLLRLIVPKGAPRNAVRRGLTLIAESWIGVNNLLIAMTRGTHWDLELPAALSRQGSYLVVCNHQSWVDIVVLQRCFNRRIPLLRFFLKRELIWVPVLGLCWWALDFPFMHRASREELKQRPELRGRDLESARRACEKFAEVPVAMMSFPEGTRRRAAKLGKDSDYRHLLRPKAGGIGQVVYALGDHLDGCVDVTIAYGSNGQDAEPPGFWDLLRGTIPAIQVQATLCDIPDDLLGRNFMEDREARQHLQDWVSGLWREKDERLAALQN
ncbi:MAG: acyltransferase [Pseudomonadota bacterium]